MNNFSNIVGSIILSGGQSRRMGTPKACLPIGNELMLQRITRIVGSILSPVVVVHSPDQKLPALPDKILLAQDAVAGEGPLRGFEAGLNAIQGRAEWVFLTSCDAPLLQPDVIRLLVSSNGDTDVVIPEVDGHLQPLMALYRTGLLGVVEALLADRTRSLQTLIERADKRVITEEVLKRVDPDLKSFQNVNTPEAYQALLASFETQT